MSNTYAIIFLSYIGGLIFMKKKYVYLFFFLFLSICFPFIIAYFLFYYILDRRATYQESMDSITKDPDEIQLATIMFAGTKSWQHEVKSLAKEWNVYSHDNLKLFGLFLENQTHSYIILCHGLTSSHTGMLGRAEHFYRNGFNVLIPDARAHGKSEGQYRGMGFLEKRDLEKWIEKIISIDPRAQIVLMGESMGAATVMMTASQKLVPQVKCVIEDCGYTSVWDIFSYQLKLRYHLPAFPFMHIASLICKFKADYSFKEASPLNVISNCHLPLLMIHGTADNVVPHEHMKKLYQRANNPKQSLLVDGAGHCISMVRNTKLYWYTIDTFISKYMQ